MVARYFVSAAAFAASDWANLRRKRSTRPAVSISFCLPVKKGWQAEQISSDDVALVGGARLEVGAAGALDGDVVVVRVNAFFGMLQDPLLWPGRLAVRLRTGLVTVTSKGLSRCRLAS